MTHTLRRRAVAVAMTALATGLYVTPANAWEPTRNVEFIVPAGTGGGADQMARMIQGIITKHNLMKQSVVVVNKAGGAGGEGFLDIKNSKANPRVSREPRSAVALSLPFECKQRRRSSEGKEAFPCYRTNGLNS